MVANFAALVFKVAQGKTTPLAQVAPWVPPRLAEVVDSTLQPLDRRVPTVEPLERALGAAISLPPRLRAADLVRVR